MACIAASQLKIRVHRRYVYACDYSRRAPCSGWAHVQPTVKLVVELGPAENVHNAELLLLTEQLLIAPAALFVITSGHCPIRSSCAHNSVTVVVQPGWILRVQRPAAASMHNMQITTTFTTVSVTVWLCTCLQA